MAIVRIWSAKINATISPRAVHMEKPSSGIYGETFCEQREEKIALGPAKNTTF